MVVAMSTLHKADPLLEKDYTFLSSGWWVKRWIVKLVDEERRLKTAAHYFLKSDAKFNRNRVFLIHAENDEIFPPSISFELNRQQANIPESQTLLLKGCGHGLDGNETLILLKLIE